MGKTRLKNISVAIEPVLVAPQKPPEPPPPLILQQQQQQLRLQQQQIKTEPTDLTTTTTAVAQQSQEETEKKDSVANCVIGGPPPPVESLLAHINSQLETGGGIKAEIDSEFLSNTADTSRFVIWCFVIWCVKRGGIIGGDEGKDDTETFTANTHITSSFALTLDGCDLMTIP